MNQYKIPVSINCICKNEETILESAIDSVAPYVEEILFVDHYSFDNTLEIAKVLQQRHNNFRILEKQNDSLMNYTDVRELARINSKCDYVMKYDGDFILTDHVLLKKYVEILKCSDRRLTLSDKVIAISFLVNDLFRDINHIVNRNGYGEPYVFKKDAIHFYNNGEFPDAYKIIDKGIIKRVDISPIIHINNVKPIINILYRIRMTEYAIQTSFKGNYFEWLYFINNNRVASREELVNSMINYLRAECIHRLDSDKNIVSPNTVDINNMLRNSCLAQIKIIKRNEGYFYDRTIILQYKNKIYYYPEDINSIELKNTLLDMYDDKVFDKFI